MLCNSLTLPGGWANTLVANWTSSLPCAWPITPVANEASFLPCAWSSSLITACVKPCSEEHSVLDYLFAYLDTSLATFSYCIFPACLFLPGFLWILDLTLCGFYWTALDCASSPGLRRDTTYFSLELSLGPTFFVAPRPIGHTLYVHRNTHHYSN